MKIPRSCPNDKSIQKILKRFKTGLTLDKLNAWYALQELGFPDWLIEHMINRGPSQQLLALPKPPDPN